MCLNEETGFLSSMFCGFSSFIALTFSYVNYHNFSLVDKETTNVDECALLTCTKFTAVAGDKL